MDYSINNIWIDNFKSYATLAKIIISDMSVFLGANSSGKSTAIQALLALKQTMECNSRDIELLLSGKYVALGDFDDVIYDKSRNDFSFGINFKCIAPNKTTEGTDSYRIVWWFKKAKDKFQALLSTIDITYEDKHVLFERISLNKYQMIIDGEATPIIVHIQNLNFRESLLLKYDIQFNKIFANFINEMKKVVEGEKIIKVDSNELVTLKVVPEFFLGFLNDEILNNKDEYDNNEEVKEIEEISNLIVNLIEKCSLFQNPFGNEFFGMSHEMKRNCMITIIKRTGRLNEFKKIYEKYLGLFEKCKNNKVNISNLDGEEEIPCFVFLRLNSGENKMREVFQRVNDLYSDFEKIVTKLFFVGPIRENPKGLYSIGFEENPKYVGPTGSNFASVLLHENKSKKYFLPYDKEDTISLWDALNEWATHLNIASEIKVTHPTSYGIKVSVSDTQNKTADIMNVGIGTSQVLPVLITGLLSEKEETLIFEQPELHLHPFSQSRLVDFFIALIKRGRKIIIETHSEAFILRLRYHILKENCNKDSIAINFFQNIQGTKVSLCNISGFGNIDYPRDFKDETQELLNDLMNAALKRGLQ